ncbi:MAG: hypothetical protein COA58_08485 [Bacteroidetes bacterium]|nr:MAG: hypothetical protein COA58_08485 [Bacteroidota bacterium]
MSNKTFNARNLDQLEKGISESKDLEVLLSNLGHIVNLQSIEDYQKSFNALSYSYLQSHSSADTKPVLDLLEISNFLIDLGDSLDRLLES